jgi:hypothetical protein
MVAKLVPVDNPGDDMAYMAGKVKIVSEKQQRG